MIYPHEKNKLENKKNIEVIKVTIISGIKLVKIFIIEKVNFSEINIASVMADGPIIRGIATGKIRKLNRNWSLTFLLTNFCFLWFLLSNNISKAIKKRKIPPAIWNEYIDIPKNSKNKFPNIAKNVINAEVKIKRNTDIKNSFFSGILSEREANIGIKATGSIATKVLKKFWMNISDIITLKKR